MEIFAATPKIVKPMEEIYNPKSCNALEKPYYSPIEAALRWCGLIDHEVKIVEKVGQNGMPGLADFPQWPCLRANAEKIYDAMLNDELVYGRDGKKVAADDHVAPPRRTVRHGDLKAWMAKHYPDQKPPFLFDEVERATHASITVETVQALQADRDSLKARVVKGHDMYRLLQQQVSLMAEELDTLRPLAEKTEKLDRRAETTYLNIIGAMCSLMIADYKPGQKFSSFKDHEAIIDALVANYSDKRGISERTLHEKFAAAKNSLGQP